MKLSQHQQRFVRNFGVFLHHIAVLPGVEVTFGEAYRPPDWQKEMVKRGLSQTEAGDHPRRLAIDLNLFIKGVYQTNTKAYQTLGEIWKSIDVHHYWGGDWKTFKDGNHFGYKDKLE